ncbi:DUF2877 domain-containing protein [Ornithinibacillus halotolerans]|uniref:DUF2877 domain-containing protein n=1 Tax=Ornithinibacillus halotolerans TaxID=1274357 RepID=A0A916RRH0_9BACI|nr:DUF2877 domain-containing protein [Ornithinibacillus halotolerans]GGA66077.1 hypothetical protein GCM10008025_07360 [Ornithinibacillus halotolerans]
MKEFIFYGEEHHSDLPLLLSENNVGRVHSIFQNGINIKMGDSLVFIGNTKNGRLPFGIHLKEEVLDEFIACVEDDLVVCWKGFSLYFANKEILMKLDLQPSTPFVNSLPIFRKEKVIFPSFEKFITLFISNGEPIGIEDLFVNQLLLYYIDDQQIEQSKLANSISNLMDALLSDDKVFINDSLRYFLGRGNGLTPSGDDILVGILAVHAVTEMFSQAFIDELKEIIQSEPITTDVSKEYLKYALNRKFSSVVVNIMTDLQEENSSKLEQHFNDLVQVGHSSGVDSAFGLLIGILTLRRKK